MAAQEIPVDHLMDTPAGRDEAGTPDEYIEYCETHDVLYREGGACLDCEREEVEQ